MTHGCFDDARAEQRLSVKMVFWEKETRLKRRMKRVA